jgi:hypothetical protein
MTMALDSFPASPIVFVRSQREGQKGRASFVADMKARQSSKIRELGNTLAAAGFLTLDEQAKALGLCRSTTWTVLKGNHKGSGLSATIINRILAAPLLPPLVRANILEYVAEKAAGLYGHGKTPRRKFTARLSLERMNDARNSTRNFMRQKENDVYLPIQRAGL